MIVRRINGEPGGILGFNETGQYHACLFQNDLPLNGRIRNEDLLSGFIHFFAKDGCRKTDKQQQQAQNQRGESFSCDIHSFLYLVSLSLWA